MRIQIAHFVFRMDMWKGLVVIEVIKKKKSYHGVKHLI